MFVERLSRLFVFLTMVSLVLMIYSLLTFVARKTEVTIAISSIESNCTKLFAGDKEEISRVKSELNHWKNSVSDEEVLEKTENCSWVHNYLIGNFYITELELSFPIAFTFVVYNSPQQILRLFRFHYRQHNVYCIHPDKKSSRIFIDIFHNIATCLDNVIIPETLVDVVWGTESIMDAQMTCLRELVQFREKQANTKKWRGCKNPEEHYYATVYMIPGVPGGYDRKLRNAYFDTMSCFWNDSVPSCGGKFVHNVCVVSVTDLKEIVKRSGDGKYSLFHNKYFMEVDHVVMDCMEERLIARNKLEYQLQGRSSQTIAVEKDDGWTG